MICKKCGWKIYDKAVVCPHCGAPTGVTPNTKKPEAKKKRDVNGFAIAGLTLGGVNLVLVLSYSSGCFLFFPLPIFGIVFSSLGLWKAKEIKKGRKMAIWGLVVSIIGAAFLLLVCILLLLAVI